MKIFAKKTWNAFGNMSNSMGVFLLGMFCGFVVLEAVPRYIDQRSGPWMQADLGWTRDENGAVVINYDLTVHKQVEAIWTAWAETHSGMRMTSRSGVTPVPYKLREPGRWPWTWHSFFENGRDDPPPQPTLPHRVCVSYAAESYSGAHQGIPRSCTPVLNPITEEYHNPETGEWIPVEHEQDGN